MIALCYSENISWRIELNFDFEEVNMKNFTRCYFVIVFVCVLFLTVGAIAAPYQVTFETTDCNGDTGFVTVAIDEIFKVQSAGCSDSTGTQLKQMLIHNGSGSYNAYTLTEEESKNVRQEIKDYMASRRKLLDRSNAVIVQPE